MGGIYVTDTEHFNMSHSLMMDREVDSLRTAHQDIRVRSERSTRETFTLSGWARGYGLVKRERAGAEAPRFALRAEIHYKDSYYNYYETEEVTAEFSPSTEEWQLASIQFTKSEYRIIDFIRVYCDYSYNFGTAYFDDIQLVRNCVETGLSEDAFGKRECGDGEDAGSKASSKDTAKPFKEKEWLTSY